MQQVADWLEKLGMSEYGQRFAENRIDFSVLPDLTDQDLEKLGVVLGDRRKMLRAIGKLTGASVPAPQYSAATKPALLDTAERRQVTVMFSDLVGSTALSARMDPEDLREVISAYQKCVAETVQRFGGFVAKYMGDGVLVYFGYPQAHEDDAERAARAGLALIEAVGKLGSAEPLQIRIGVATGLVVVGDLVGSGAAQEQAIVGETPNLAARLQAAAAPSTLVIDPTTRRLLAGLFEYRDLGAIEAKGFTNPVQAYEVVRPSTVESRFEALRTATTPLVGRDEEVDLLLRRWEQAKRGDGCVVLISGEPGIGKSRIAQTIVERLGSEPHSRLRYFCSPHYQDSALYPSIAQLERAAGFRREDTAEQRLAKLEAVLAQGTNDLSEVVPLLADLLSIPTGDRYTPLNLTPQKRKEKTLQAQLAQLEGLAARQPVLMVWEDLHWSDPTTRESLDLIIDRVPRLRVLMILTFRPEFTPPWIGRPHVALLTLNRLPRRQGAEMIAYVTGGKALPKEISDQIVDRTDGVPLFIEELTKTVVESGIVAEAGDHYAMARPIALLAIPTSLHASLLARLDTLAPTREVAQIGAALGRSFSYELISAVAGMPQQKLDGALEQLAGAGLIFRRGVSPDAEYTFKHALVQDAAYSTLLRNRRQQIHARIAATLESQFPEIVATQPGLLAGHCAEAALTEKAVGYCIKAGQQAVSRSAMIEGVTQLRKGVDLLALFPDEVERRQYELDLKVALAASLVATKGYSAPEVAELYARVRTLCEELNQPSLLVWVATGQWTYHVTRGELTLALRDAQELVALGQTRDDPVIKLLGCNSNTVTWAFLGDFLKARFYGEQGVALRVPELHTYAEMWPDDLQTAAFLFLSSMALMPLGYVDQALAWRDRGVALARERGHANSLILVLFHSLVCDFILGADPAILLALAEEQTALCSEHGQPFWGAEGACHLGRCLTAIGRAEEGLALQRNAIAAFRTMGVTVPRHLVVIADTCRRAGRLNEGLTALDELERLIEATHDRADEALLHLIRGDLLLGLGDLPAAQASFQKSIDVARRQSAKLYELRAANGLARLWRDQGKRAEARDLLTPIYGWFIEGFDTPVLQEAKSLLDELS
jgi:class 3 adenylate cyclase/tetratricopeptide (TPR) repeat protein